MPKKPDCEHQFESEPECQPAFRNFYSHCGADWQADWSAMCNDDCPMCGAEIEPHHSEELAPCACDYLNG